MASAPSGNRTWRGLRSPWRQACSISSARCVGIRLNSGSHWPPQRSIQGRAGVRPAACSRVSSKARSMRGASQGSTSSQGCRATARPARMPASGPGKSRLSSLTTRSA
uniref:Uncharacterized protein n=1 Tax=Pseudomonas aeruginosa TaxID=287 RepID=O68800_PSEAI|nr:unknown [Pseudomonas aeruginosa PAO1]